MLLDDRIVIPHALRKQILQSLHSARAKQCVCWPRMSKSVIDYKGNCEICVLNAPSQQREPLILSPPPQWPFQQVYGDFFSVTGHDYLYLWTDSAVGFAFTILDRDND